MQAIEAAHGHHLTDALPKLLGLARFAERYGDELLRIEAVAKVDDDLRMLDILIPRVREAITNASSASELYRSDVAETY